MNTDHAQRVLDHLAEQFEREYHIRVEYSFLRQQWIAHKIGNAALQGYGRTATEAVDMLKRRSPQ